MQNYMMFNSIKFSKFYNITLTLSIICLNMFLAHSKSQ